MTDIGKPNLTKPTGDSIRDKAKRASVFAGSKKSIRFNANIPENHHKRLKRHSLETGENMGDWLVRMIEENVPE